jgi:hypothetical protein
LEFDKTLRVREKNKGQYYIRFLRVSLSVAGGIHLSLGNRISVFHLERQPQKIWLICICAMHGGIGVDDGNAYFRSHHDHFSTWRRSVRCDPRGARKDQFAGSRKLSRKILDRGKMRSRDRPTLPFCLCHAYLLSTTGTAIAKIHKG